MLVYQRIHFHHGFQMENQKKCGDRPVESASLSGVVPLETSEASGFSEPPVVMTDGDGLVDWVYHIPGLVTVYITMVNIQKTMERSTIL